MTFDLESARQAAEDGRIGDWVDDYLRSGAWANLGLADGLGSQARFWVGPVRVPLDGMRRGCGPEEGMEFRQELHSWRRRVERIM